MNQRLVDANPYNTPCVTCHRGESYSYADGVEQVTYERYGPSVHPSEARMRLFEEFGGRAVQRMVRETLTRKGLA